MKKSLALLMALTAALSMSATTLFFHPNENWRKDNARFAVKTPSTWFDLALVPGEDGIYSAVVGDLPDNVIFYRMDPSKKENILANKWNETNEMSIPYGENLYIMDEGVWDRGGGYWTKYAATPAEGSLYMWNGIGSTSKGTEVGGDSWVSKSDERVLVGAGQRGNSCLKINGDLAGGYYIGIELKNGSVNAEDQIVLADFRTSDDKSYRLSIQFFADVNASSPQASFMTTADPQVLAEEGAPAQSTFTVPAGVSNATYLRVCRTSGEACIWVAKLELIKKGSAPDPGPGPEPQPEDPTVTVIGSMTDWSAEIPFVLSADKKTATLVEDNIPAGTYEFKIKLNGEWRSNGYTFHREFTHADGITMNENDNMVLQADITGKYSFTWTFETNSLDIVFPAKDPDPQPVDKSGYYIVGNHTDWKIDADYKFEANPAQEGEYVAKMFLSPEYIIKVVYSEDGENIKTWFPEGEGNAYGEHGEITETGARTIYFRPNYDGGDDWFAGCIYVVVDQGEAIEDLNASEKAVKVIRNGQIVILKGDKAFNILGSQVD